MRYLDLKTASFIHELERLEQVWFEITLPALGALTQAAESISDREFDATYSEEQADRDPNYDARRELERDWDFNATHSQLLDARQLTVHAFFIVLRHIIEQNLADIICYLEEGQVSKVSKKSDSPKEKLKALRINLEAIQGWQSIIEIQHVANYLKHGVGDSSRKIEAVLAQYLGSPHDPELEEITMPPPGQGTPILPSLPLRNSGCALSEDTLRFYMAQTRLFFAELGKQPA